MRMLVVGLFAFLQSVTPFCVPEPSGGGSWETNYLVRPSGGDDTARLIAAIKNHAHVSIDEPLLINGVVDLTGVKDKTIVFTGNGKLRRTKLPNTRTWQVLLLKQVKNVKVIRPVIEGPFKSCNYNSALEAQHGIEINSSELVRIESPKVINMAGDGIYFDASYKTQTRDITVTDPYVSCVGRNAVSNCGSENVRIDGGTYKKAGLWIFNVEPFGNRVVNHYWVDRPTVGQSDEVWFLATGPDFNCEVHNVVINKPTFLPDADRGRAQSACVAPNIKILF
jgi:hypothetical protein